MGHPATMSRVTTGFTGHSKPRHVAGLELIVLSLLLLRVVRALPPAIAAIVLCARHFWRVGKRVCRRLALWRDRHWRRPRYTLRCDLAAVEPGSCPVCLAPLAGPPFADEDEEAAEPRAVEEEVSSLGVTEASADALSNDGVAVANSGQRDFAPLFRLRCGHTFHAPCLNGWIDRRGTCPLCRADVGDNRDWVELLSLEASSTDSARDVTLRLPERMRQTPVEPIVADADLENGSASEPMLHGPTCSDTSGCDLESRGDGEELIRPS